MAALPQSFAVRVTYVHPLTRREQSQIAHVEASSDDDAIREAQAWVMNCGATLLAATIEEPQDPGYDAQPHELPGDDSFPSARDVPDDVQRATPREERREALRVRTRERQREQKRRLLRRALVALESACELSLSYMTEHPSTPLFNSEIEYQTARATDTLRYMLREMEQD